MERVLLRALAVTDPEYEPARRLAAEAIAQQPAWFEHLGAFPALQALAGRRAGDPMDVVEDEAQRALLAEVLLAETKPPEEGEVESAIQEMEERAIEQPAAGTARADCRSRAARRLCRTGRADAAEAGDGPRAAAAAQSEASGAVERDSASRVFCGGACKASRISDGLYFPGLNCRCYNRFIALRRGY